MRVAHLLALSLCIACGSSAAEPPTEISTGGDRTNAPAPDAPLLPESWAELERAFVGQYVGRLEHRAAEGVFCEIPDRACAGSASVPAEWCGVPNQPPIGYGWADPPGAPAFIFTSMRDGAERPLVVATCSAPCAEPDRDALVREVRCHELAALSTGAHPEHQRCDGDADCALLHSMCFDAAVSVAFEAPYRAAHDRHAGECLPAGGGACSMPTRTVTCIEHVCTVR